MNFEKISRIPVVSDLFYIAVGISLALLFYQVIGFALDTQEPLVDVVSESMYPTLTRGDLLVLKGVEQGDMISGMVVVYHQPEMDRLIVHRIFAMNDDGSFITKGDNEFTNEHPDPWVVQPEWVKGEVLFRVPYLGYPRIALEELLNY